MGTHPIFESDFDCLTEIMDVDGNGSSSDIGYDIDMEDLHPNENKTRKGSTKHQKKDKTLHRDYWRNFGDPFDHLKIEITPTE